MKHHKSNTLNPVNRPNEDSCPFFLWHLSKNGYLPGGANANFHASQTAPRTAGRTSIASSVVPISQGSPGPLGGGGANAPHKGKMKRYKINKSAATSAHFLNFVFFSFCDIPKSFRCGSGLSVSSSLKFSQNHKLKLILDCNPYYAKKPILLEILAEVALKSKPKLAV